jgi:cyclopropane fatty-acyl-phospholipid synthase-like methyltransferase
MDDNFSPAKQYFRESYFSGFDSWSGHYFTQIVQEVLEKNIQKKSEDSLLLDIGCGRGFTAFELAKQYKVIAIDSDEYIINKNIERVAQTKQESRLRFLKQDFLDNSIQFQEKSFEVVLDIGTFQHLQKESYNAYAQKVSQLLVSGGYYLSIQLSQKTDTFFGQAIHVFKKEVIVRFGLAYNFFSQKSLNAVFAMQLELIESKEIVCEYMSQKDVGFLVTLWKQK